MSPPTRGRGLKHLTYPRNTKAMFVAPYTGAWIETFVLDLLEKGATGRPLHGGVD